MNKAELQEVSNKSQLIHSKTTEMLKVVRNLTGPNPLSKIATRAELPSPFFI